MLAQHQRLVHHALSFRFIRGTGTSLCTQFWSWSGPRGSKEGSVAIQHGGVLGPMSRGHIVDNTCLLRYGWPRAMLKYEKKVYLSL